MNLRSEQGQSLLPKTQTFSTTFPGCCEGEAADDAELPHPCSISLQFAAHPGDAVALLLSRL